MIGTMSAGSFAATLFLVQALPAQTAGADLDAIAKRVMAQQGVVGASVLVARGNHIVIHKGYWFADLAL